MSMVWTGISLSLLLSLREYNGYGTVVTALMYSEIIHSYTHQSTKLLLLLLCC